MSYETLWFGKKIMRTFFFSVLILGGVTFLPDSVVRPFRTILLPLFTPFENFFSWLAFEVRDGVDLLQHVRSVKVENERLTQEILKLREESISVAELQQENRLLREAFGLSQDPSRRSLPAEVIGRDADGLSLFLTVNRGSLQGVKTEQPVFVGEKTMVGQIVEVAPTSSRVRLLSHPESTVAVQIAGTDTQAVVRGDHGLGMFFDMASSEAIIPTGARLVTSGLDGTLPKGLFIGEVQEVRHSSDQLFQVGAVMPPVPYSSLRFVSILFLSS